MRSQWCDNPMPFGVYVALINQAVGTSATDTMWCSASDLYLSLVIFSNTALAFVFAESLRWLPHIFDSLSLFLSITVSRSLVLLPHPPLCIVSAHQMPFS